MSRDSFRIAFRGPSGSGKTTLITRLLDRFHDIFRIGYVKLDVRAFQIDREGKDTDRVRKHGATTVIINDGTHAAAVGDVHTGQPFQIMASALNDFLLVETHHEVEFPTIYMLGPDENGCTIPRGHCLALVGPGTKPPDAPITVPYFQRDDIEGIGDVLLTGLRAQASAVRLNALFICDDEYITAGKGLAASSRQVLSNGLERRVRLLSKHCTKLFIAQRDMADRPMRFCRLPVLQDTFFSKGVLGPLVSALISSPGEAWLVLSSDCSGVSESQLRLLLHERNPFKMATVLYNPRTGEPDWFPAVFEPKCVHALISALGEGIVSLYPVLPPPAVHCVRELERPVAIDSETEETADSDPLPVAEA